MKKLFTLFLILFSTLFGGTLAAQELKVASFEPLPQDVAARSNAVLDNNDNPCALLRVVVAVEGIEIRGNYGRVGDVINPRASEYAVYLPAGTRTIYINSPGFMPLTYDIGYKLEGKMAYRLTLERPQLPVGPTKPEIKRQHVKITLPTPSSTVLIDGMPQQTSNGAFVGSFSLGKHTYYISAPQHYPEEGEFTLTTSGRIDLTVALKPSYMPLNLRVSPANATVQIDGQMLTLTRGQLTQKFEIGKHTYQISAPQHYTQSGEFEITASGQNALAINLKPSYMPLNLRVSPSNATVMIDGQMITLTGGQLTQKFEIGKHTYQISAPQHYTQTGEFEISATEQNSLNFNLKPSYMALNLRVSPANATVLIDGTQYQLTGGSLTQKFEIGKHTYQIMASQYHSASGEFEITALGGTDLDITLKPAFGFLQATSNPVGAEVRINGEKRGVTPCKLQLPSGQYSVQLVSDGYISHAQQVTITDGVTLPFSNTLTANFAQITLKAPHPYSEIWVNDQFKAKGEWSGHLDANTYLVETRTEGYETVSENVEVVAGVPRTVTLQKPNPIYGLLEILSDPFDATIKLDGKVVGTTPWQSNEVLTGKHTIEIIKEEYNPYTQEFTLTQEQPVTIEAVLDNRPAYKMEEFFPIFGDAVFLGKTTVEDLKGKNYPVKPDDNGDFRCKIHGWEFSSKDGDEIFEHIEAWNYDGMPVKWSLLGFDWSHSYDQWIELFEKLGFNIEKEPIETRSEYQGRTCLDAEFTATSKDGSISFNLDFDFGNKKGEGYSTSSKNSLWKIYVDVYPIGSPNYMQNIKKKYKVGDYYNENGKKGVVFWVDETGEHGKIISMTESRLTPLKWFSGYYKYYNKELKQLIGADSRTDGAKNMEAVKNRKDWQSKYPAFKWCADLGAGWYLPAIDELKIFTLNKWVYDTVNQTLALHGGRQLVKSLYRYWSSTEKNELYEGYYKNVWVVDLAGYLPNGTYSEEKDYYSGGIVRAVAAF